LEYQLTVESIPDFEPVDPEKLKFTRLTHEATALNLAKAKSLTRKRQKQLKPKKVTPFLSIL